MSTEYKDVLRVFTGESAINGTLRNKQLGFETDGSHRMVVKDGSGVSRYWSPDGATGIDASDVTYTNGDFPAISYVDTALDYLLTEEISIESLTNDINTVEKGGSVTAVEVEWECNVTSNKFLLEDPDNDPGILTGGLTGSYSYNYIADPLGPTGIYSFDLEVENARNTDTDITQVTFGLYSYWGQSAQPYSSITESIIEAYSNGGRTLERDTTSSKTKGTFSQAGGSNYIYYAYPASWGTISNIIVNGFSSTWNYSTVSVTNAEGNTENYYAYVSPNVIAGTVTLQFS